MAETVKIELIVDAKGAVQGIRAAGQELKGLGTSGQKAGLSFAKLTASFISAQAIIGVVTGGFRALAGAVSGSIGSAQSFQSAFIGVQKTLDTGGLNALETAALFGQLEDEFRELATTIPISVEELAGIGEIAGQLGVGAADITEFTEVIAKLGVTTSLTTEAAATQLARFATVTGGIDSTNFQALGATIVALGNNFATTEPEILNFAQRIAATGAIVGLSQTDILAFGTALTSVGVQAEAGGTAIQKTFIEIASATKSGGQALNDFAAVAGVSADKFRQNFADDAASATADFIEGLNRIQEAGGNVFSTLEKLGLGNARTVRSLLSAAKAGDQLRNALELGREEFERSIAIQLEMQDSTAGVGMALDALDKEAQLRFGSFESQAMLAGASLNDLAIEIGSLIVENQALGEVMGFIAEAFKTATEFVKENRTELIQLVSDGISLAIDGIVLLTDAFQIYFPVATFFLELAVKMARASAILFDTWVQAAVAIGLLPESVGNFTESLREGLATFDDGLDTVQNFVSGEGGLGTMQERLAGLQVTIGEATKKQIEHEAAIAATGIDLDKLNKGLKEGAEETGGLGDAAGEASEDLKSLQDAFAKISSGQLSKDAALLSTVIAGIGGAAELSVAQLEAAGKQIDTFEKNGVKLSATLEEVKVRLEEIAKTDAIKKLVDEIQALGAEAKKNEAMILVDALEELGGVTELSETQVEALAGKAIELGLSAKEAADVGIQALLDKLRELENQKAIDGLIADFARLNGAVSQSGADAFQNIQTALGATRDEFGELSNQAIQEAINQLDKLAETDPGLVDEIKALKDEFDLVTGATFDWGSSLEQVDRLFRVLGVSSDSFFAQTLGGLTALGTGFQNLASIGGEEGIGGLFGGLKDTFAEGSKDLGGGILGSIGGALSIAGPIAAVAGPAIAGISALIGGLFKSEAEKIAKDVERDFGVEISEGLSKAIEQTAKDLDLGRFEATLLNLGDIFAEAGSVDALGGIGDAALKVGDLFNAIAIGAVPAEQGIAEVGEAFSFLASEVVEAGRIADGEFLALIERSRQLGIEVPEIAEFIAAQLADAAKGITSIIGQAFEVDGEEVFGGIQIFSAEDAQAQATIFAAGFFATLEEEGILAAVDAFKPAFEELRKKTEQFGGDIDFGGVQRLFRIAGDEQFRPLLEGVQGLNDAMVGLANAGFLTADSFSAFQQQGQSAFDQLIDAGLREGEALQQLAPFLQSAIDASNRFGFELDANTQSLITQAEAAGIAFEVDPLLQVVDALGVIAQLLGATDEQLASIGGTAGTTADRITGTLPPAFDEAGRAAAGVGPMFEEGFRGVDPAAQIEPSFRRIPDAAGKAGEEAGRNFANALQTASEALQIEGDLGDRLFIDSADVANNLSAAREAFLTGGAEVSEAFVEGLSRGEQVDLINTIFGDDPSGDPERLAQLLGDPAAISAAIQANFEGTGEVISDAFLDPIEETVKPAIDSLKENIEGVSEAFGGVQEDIAGTGDAAIEATGVIQESFATAAAGIEEGLGPVSDKIAVEIRQVGEETAKALDTSFDATNKAIEEGLIQVAGTFAGPVVDSANKAAAAARSIADAAREAARAAAEIDFPSGGGDRTSAGGFRGLLQKDVTMDLHRGELVNVMPAATVRNMRARGERISAQEGFGGISIDLGGVSIQVEGGGRNGGGEAPGEPRMSDEEFAEQLGRVFVDNVGNVVEDVVRETLFEQT